MEQADHPVVVVVRRTARVGKTRDFEDAMRAFIAESAAAPGSLDFHVLRSCDDASREYTVVHRFADQSSRRAFVQSEMYGRWMARLREVTESEPHIQEFDGLAGWFVLPSKERPHAHPPRWKMALVTFMGVYPLTSTIPGWTAAALPGVHRLAANAVGTAIIVAALTWAVMPLLTRLFATFLFPERNKEAP